MSTSVVSSLVVALGLVAGVARADSVGAPAEAASVAKSPVSAVAYAEPVAEQRAEPAAPAPAPDRNRVEAAAPKLSRQAHTGYYVNRVKLLLPAGVKVVVRKDWYTKEVVLVYAANPYTDWQGVTPPAFAFKHTGTTLEVWHATPKYLPATVTLTVPAAVDVIVP